jgi:hypothetical protein
LETSQPHPLHEVDDAGSADTDTSLSGEAVAEPSGDENEAPAGEYQTATQAELEVAYAKASVNFRSAKAEYEYWRKELVIIIQSLGTDKDNLLTQRLASPMAAYELPLPMTFAEIRSYTGWSVQKANSWLKYRLTKGSIKKRGSRGRYQYYYPTDPLGEQYYFQARGK